MSQPPTNRDKPPTLDYQSPTPTAKRQSRFFKPLAPTGQDEVFGRVVFYVFYVAIALIFSFRHGC